MKKIIALFIILLPVFASLTAAAYNDGFDYESYATFKAAWPSSLDKTADGGFIGLPSEINYDGVLSQVLNVRLDAGKRIDPFAQKDSFNFSRETLTSFDIKLSSNVFESGITWREGVSGAAVWNYPFQIRNGAATVFGVPISYKGISDLRGMWLRVRIITAPEIGTKNMTYRVTVNSEKVAEGIASTSQENAPYTAVSIRAGLASPSSALADDSNLWLDNFFVVPTSELGLDRTAVVPADGAEDVAVADGTVKFTFPAPMDFSTLIPENITVTKEFEGDTDNISGFELTKSLSSISIKLADKLDKSTKYTIELSEGIKDEYGNSIPWEKRKVSFSTVEDAFVYVPAYKDEIIFEDDFNAGAFFPSGYSSTANGETAEVKQYDSEHGNSASLTTVNSAPAGPYFTRVFTADEMRRFENTPVAFEADVLLTTTTHTLSLFMLRAEINGAASFDTSVMFMPDGSIARVDSSGKSAQKLADYEANKWYKIRLVRDPVSKTFSIYIDGEKKTENIPFVNQNIIIPPNMRFTLNSGTSAPCTAYVDNFKAFRTIEIPGITKLRFIDAEGKLKSKTAPLNTREIAVYFSMPMQQSSMNENNITLTRTSGNIPVRTTGRYEPADSSYRISLNENVKGGINYNINVSKEVKNAVGDKLEVDLTQVFPSAPDGYGAKNLCLLLDGEEISSLTQISPGDTVYASADMINETGEDKEALLILGVYENGVMKQAFLSRKTVPAGGVNIQTAGAEFTPNTSFKIFVWDGMSGKIAVTEHKTIDNANHG